MKLPYIFTVLVVPLSLAGCSDEGIGFAHHPLDCAIGIAWGDCLPGTPGYAHQSHPQPPAIWVKPGQTQQAFAQDKYGCMQDARVEVSRSSAVGGTVVGNTYLPGRGMSESGEAINHDLFAACMEARGYLQE